MVSDARGGSCGVTCLVGHWSLMRMCPVLVRCGWVISVVVGRVCWLRSMRSRLMLGSCVVLMILV